MDVSVEAMEMVRACFYWDLRALPTRLLDTLAREENVYDR